VICREFQCIFVHIPKVAGQSIEQFFLQLLGLSWQMRGPLCLRYNRDPKQGPHRLAHLTASEYVSCGHINQQEFNSYFKFAFVRNPWDRLVSEYEFRRNTLRCDFKAFLFRRFPSTEPSDAYRHVLPQYKFLFDENGDKLVDFIGRFERLSTDFEIVRRRLHIGDTAGEFPHRNRAHFRKPYQEYYDDASREFVAGFYARDIDLFNYSFDSNAKIHGSRRK
jgi:hypothetical protein